MRLVVWISALGMVAACASGALAKPHVAADSTFFVVSGGAACPTGTTQLYSGSSVIFKNPTNGNLTEDARCWQTPPSTTSAVEVEVLGPCTACRFGS